MGYFPAVKTILFILCVSFATRASASGPENEPARDAALQWLRVIDSGNYKDAALMLSGYVRPSRDWANYFASVRAPFGRMRNRHFVELKHASTIPGDPEFRQHAIVRFKSSFEQGVAIEEIVLAKAGCCWETLNYSMTPARSQ